MIVEVLFREEIDVVRTTNQYRSFNFSFFFSASRFILVCTFLVYGLTSDVLTAETAFVTLSLYNTVRNSMTFFFPVAISQVSTVTL